MQEMPSKPRPGVNCPPDTNGAAQDLEILPAYQPDGAGMVQIGRVRMNRSTTLESPFFWMLIGAALGATGAYFILRERNRR